jgi:hypothetical protein
MTTARDLAKVMLTAFLRKAGAYMTEKDEEQVGQIVDLIVQASREAARAEMHAHSAYDVGGGR